MLPSSAHEQADETSRFSRFLQRSSFVSSVWIAAAERHSGSAVTSAKAARSQSVFLEEGKEDVMNTFRLFYCAYNSRHSSHSVQSGGTFGASLVKHLVSCCLLKRHVSQPIFPSSLSRSSSSHRFPLRHHRRQRLLLATVPSSVVR